MDELVLPKHSTSQAPSRSAPLDPTSTDAITDLSRPLWRLEADAYLKERFAQLRAQNEVSLIRRAEVNQEKLELVEERRQLGHQRIDLEEEEKNVKLSESPLDVGKRSWLRRRQT